MIILQRGLGLLFVLLLLPALIHAQGVDETIRSNGKTGVVVLVLATIFAGIVAFLIYLERRISRVERESRQSL